MVATIEVNSEAIIQLCHKFKVRSLDLIGSAADDSFDESKSDYDFLVTFQLSPLEEASSQYFGFLFALEDLLGRKVDLVMEEAVSNPYFRASIEKTRARIYEA